MYRHFQKWDDPSQKRVTYTSLSEITVRVIYTINASLAQKIEKALIVKYQPIDNPMQYDSHELTTSDKQKITAFINEPVKDIARFDGDIPF